MKDYLMKSDGKIPHVERVLGEVVHFIRVTGRRKDLGEQCEAILKALQHRREGTIEVKGEVIKEASIPNAVRMHLAECDRLLKENEAVRETLAKDVEDLRKLYQQRQDLEFYAKLQSMMETLG